ncbi:MFS transporter [Actinomycetaceae bacterium TAE3-ERU4]|nr:MFS transporter [Actinomycetaceae bacterium TAE3-ERU4]
MYIIATTGRTSFGVVSVDALHRYGVSASQLAVFSTIQLGIYGLAQVPVGIAIDRFGPRWVLATGAVILGAGQIMLAFVPTIGWAYLARVLVGAGDATAFVSVLRLVASWFPPRLVPLFTQITSIGGQMGQIVSAVPFLALFRYAGWQVAFSVLGGIGMAAAMLTLATLWDEPARRRKPYIKTSSLGSDLAEVAQNPYSWMGLFTHFTLMFPLAVFTLMWGSMFMRQGLGLNNGQVALALVITTVAGIPAGLIIGALVAWFPHRRLYLIFATIAVVFIAWALVLASPHPLGSSAIYLLCIVLGVAAPVSNIGFDFVRTSTRNELLGTGSAFANMGGFAASVVNIQIIGYLLDYHSHSSGKYVYADYRFALSFQLLMLIFGAVMILVFRYIGKRKWAASAR